MEPFGSGMNRVTVEMPWSTQRCSWRSGVNARGDEVPANLVQSIDFHLFFLASIRVFRFGRGAEDLSADDRQVHRAVAVEENDVGVHTLAERPFPRVDPQDSRRPQSHRIDRLAERAPGESEKIRGDLPEAH